MYKKIKEWGEKIISCKIGDILLYTIIWMILASFIFLIFKFNGRSFLYINDGIYQHFTSFQYLCDYLRDLIYDFHFQGFFNFTLGQGMDILTTLNSYDFTDPISILCACILPLSRANRYTLMIFIKLYLIGIAFLFYCHVTEHKNLLAIVAGSIAYVFSGAILFVFAMHPNYVNWAYFFPFLLGGVELYFRKNKKLPLILFVFLNIVTSYYTFYMNVILVVLYVLIQGICKVIKDRTWDSLRDELIKCLKLTGVCCIGVLLSAITLFPTIYAYINNNRIGELTGYTASALLYDLDFYKNTFEELFAPFRSSGYTSYIGFNAVLIVPLALIFMKKKQYTDIKCLFLLSLVMLGIPMVGRIMNGFGYASNRWVYALPFYASIIFVVMFTFIGDMTAKEKSFVFLTVITYVILCYFHTETNNDSLKLVTLVMLLAVIVTVGIVLRFGYPSFEPFLFALVILGACFQIYFTFSASQGNYVSNYLDENKITSSFTDYSSTAAVGYADKDDFNRTEMEENRTNVNGYNNVRGTGFYWSLVSQDMMHYYTDLDIDNVGINCGAGGLDGRTGLLEIASVKYYTRPAETDGMVPYGYKEVSSSDERFQVYENEYALSIGYTYSNYIPKSEYEDMDGIEKEQALLQGAVIEETPTNIEKAEVDLSYKNLDYEIIDTENVLMDGENITVLDTPGEINLSVIVPDNYEIYVSLNGYKLDDSFSLMQVEASRSIGSYSVTKYAQLSNIHYEWAVLRDNVLFNLGYGHAGKNNITLTFKTKATLSYDDIQIIAVPMSIYQEGANNLKEYVLEDVTVSIDQINGTITVPSERILQFSIPYSDGWKAYIDGEEATIMKSDIMYMAIPISAGTHTVELRYQTPYLRVGIVVTIATAVLYVAFEVIHHRNRQKVVKKDGRKS